MLKELAHEQQKENLGHQHDPVPPQETADREIRTAMDTAKIDRAAFIECLRKGERD